MPLSSPPIKLKCSTPFFCNYLEIYHIPQVGGWVPAMFLHTIPFGEIHYARTLIMIQQKSNENVMAT